MAIKTFDDVTDHFADQVRDPAPEWTSREVRVHDWRKYVGENVQRLWPRLSYETRLAIVLDAQDLADREDWD